MKKAGRITLVIMLVFLMLVAVIVPTKVSGVCSAESSKIATILSPTFATEEGLSNQGITEIQVSNYTPIKDSQITTKNEASFNPTLVGEVGRKHIDSSFNVDLSVSSIDASGVDLTKTSLEFWVNIDLKLSYITRGLTLTLTDADEENNIVWTIQTDELRQLLTRSELSEFDEKIFGSETVNTPIGWVKFNLPITKGVLTGNLIQDNKFIFTKMKIYQTAEEGSDQPMLFYDISLVENETAVDVITSSIQSYSTISLKASAKVVEEGQKFYIGEKFPQFMSRRDVYTTCWIGNVNYLDGEHDTSLKIMTDTGIGTNSKTYHAYGSGNFTINSSNYTVAYGLEYNGKFVSLLSDSFTAANYGKGVWIETNINELEIGTEKKLYYSVHDAFSSATIKFTSTDDDILKIKEVNYVNKYIVVEALKKGDAGITINITDDRLQGTDYEETGIINEEFSVEVVKASKNVNTTYIMLWVAFGILCAGLIYLAVKAIIDSRKIEIR